MAHQAQPVQGPAPQPTASFCKQSNGIVRIILEGTAIRLQGFDYPTTGFAVHYSAKPDPVPFYPDNSGGLSTAEEFEVDSTNGKWTCTLLDLCDNAALRDRTIVVWHKYESDFDVHWLVEVFTLKIPICGDIAAC